jgi:hypothetical protein
MSRFVISNRVSTPRPSHRPVALWTIVDEILRVHGCLPGFAGVARPGWQDLVFVAPGSPTNRTGLRKSHGPVTLEHPLMLGHRLKFAPELSKIMPTGRCPSRLLSTQRYSDLGRKSDKKNEDVDKHFTDWP